MANNKLSVKVEMSEEFKKRFDEIETEVKKRSTLIEYAIRELLTHEQLKKFVAKKKELEIK